MKAFQLHFLGVLGGFFEGFAVSFINGIVRRSEEHKAESLKHKAESN